MVQIQVQRDSTAASFRPSESIRISLRGSNASMPDAGHELAQTPQVIQ
jgi:hypothetical protein